MACEVCGGSGQSLIPPALSQPNSGWKEGIEAAAKVAEDLARAIEGPADDTELASIVFDYQQATCKAVAKRIRSLSSSPPVEAGETK